MAAITTITMAPVMIKTSLSGNFLVGGGVTGVAGCEGSSGVVGCVGCGSVVVVAGSEGGVCSVGEGPWGAIGCSTGCGVGVGCGCSPG